MSMFIKNETHFKPKFYPQGHFVLSRNALGFYFHVKYEKWTLAMTIELWEWSVRMLDTGLCLGWLNYVISDCLQHQNVTHWKEWEKRCSVFISEAQEFCNQSCYYSRSGLYWKSCLWKDQKISVVVIQNWYYLLAFLSARPMLVKEVVVFKTLCLFSWEGAIIIRWITCITDSDPHETISTIIWKQFEGLVQERRNSSALAMELHLSCTNPSIWTHMCTFHIDNLAWVW